MEDVALRIYKQELRKLSLERKKKKANKKWAKKTAAKNKRHGFKDPNPKKVVVRKSRYQRYLESSAWAAIKLDLYAIRGKVCEVCGSQNRIEVHHKTYDRMFKEEPEDLILLCSSCHQKTHNIGNH